MPSDHEVYLAIFDHDGVLVDSLELHTQAWVEMGRRSGLIVPAASLSTRPLA